jgi:phospholipase C
MTKAICASLLTLCISAMAAHAQIAAFQHIVIIQQTDRTPDNLFQGPVFAREPLQYDAQ